MKTVTKLTVAALLAIAASAPAFAQDNMKPARDTHAMSRTTDGTHAQASVPQTQPTFDPAAQAEDY